MHASEHVYPISAINGRHSLRRSEGLLFSVPIVVTIACDHRKKGPGILTGNQPSSGEISSSETLYGPSLAVWIARLFPLLLLLYCWHKTSPKHRLPITMPINLGLRRSCRT